MKRKKISDSQVVLTTGMTARSMEAKQDLERRTAILRDNLELAKHLLEEGEEAETSRTLWALTLERYGSARISDWVAVGWWLSPEDMKYEFEDASEEDEFDKWFEDMPRAKDYKWGSYWRGHESDTERFIRDRAKWAVPILEEELRETEETLTDYADVKPLVEAPTTSPKKVEEKKRGDRPLKRMTMEKFQEG